MVVGETFVEPILEPKLPIVDAHHHLWLRPAAELESLRNAQLPLESLGHVRLDKARYLFDEFLADVKSGHNLRARVFVEARSMYRAGGPGHLKSVGEIEFASGCAAMAESGIFGDARICAAIVGHADLRSEQLEDVLEGQDAVAGGRYRGVRQLVAYDPDPLMQHLGSSNPPHMLMDAKFRSGLKRLERRGLSFDAGLVETQLPELTDLARALPNLTIILNHIGIPLGAGSYKGRRQERFPAWQKMIREVARCPNVFVKLGGLALPNTGTQWYRSNPPATSAELAAEWAPYIETCIEAFGANRCMFESDFPIDSGCCTYRVLWNAFKHITLKASPEEKTALYSGTAAKVYRIELAEDAG